MQVTSINFVKASDVPKPTKNTELSAVSAQIAEAIKKAGAGQAVQFKLDTVKRWTTYALKRALTDRHGLTVQLINRDGTIYAMQVEKKDAKKK